MIKHHAIDLDASQVASVTGLKRNTASRHLMAFRKRIAEFCQRQSPVAGEMEVDESYFGLRRVKGLRGRGTSSKTIVFGLFKRKGRVYTEIVPDCSRATLQAVIRGRISLESVIHSDGWRGYTGLVDLGYMKHFRVGHGDNEFANERSHINGIEGFWGYAKSRLARFRGLKKDCFHLHFKDCEFRFNPWGRTSTKSCSKS